MSSSGHTPTDSSTSGSTSSPCVTCGKRGETSPLDSPASKKPKIDDNSATTEFIDNFLECTICLDFPISPIHSCGNAHILCGICAPHFTACPTCRHPKLCPNPLGEKLAKEANKKMECPNFEAGCVKGVLSTKFAAHLPLCYFREITCYEGLCDTKATKTKIKFHEYTKHLEDFHGEKIHVGEIFLGFYLYNERRHGMNGLTWKPWAHWGHNLIKFDGHQFILHVQVSKGSQLFFCWLSVLGDKDLAAKYFCDVKFKDPNAKTSDKFGCSYCNWKLPVLAFHEISRNEEEAKLIEYSAVSAVPLAKLGKLGADGYRCIDVTYEIKKA